MCPADQHAGAWVHRISEICRPCTAVQGRAVGQHLEPLRDDDARCGQHGPPRMQQLVGPVLLHLRRLLPQPQWVVPVAARTTACSAQDAQGLQTAGTRSSSCHRETQDAICPSHSAHFPEMGATRCALTCQAQASASHMLAMGKSVAAQHSSAGQGRGLTLLQGCRPGRRARHSCPAGRPEGTGRALGLHLYGRGQAQPLGGSALSKAS